MARQYKPISATNFLRTIVILIFAGLVIGGATSYARPYMEFGGAHVEAIICYFFLMPMICLMVDFRYLWVPFKQVITPLAIQLVALWIPHTLGTMIPLQNSGIRHDFVSVNIFFFAGSLTALLGLHWAIVKASPIEINSTNCLHCGYSLKGLDKMVCPECGRAFTLEEQGITAEDLTAN